MKRMLLALSITMLAAASLAAPPETLPSPPGLRPQVDFWKSVFATYSTNQVLIHDSLYLDRVYVVLDFEELAQTADAASLASYIEYRTNEEKDRIHAILVRLHELGDAAVGLTPDEQRIRLLFSDDRDPAKFLNAATPERLRGQRGLRDRFARGIEISRAYLPEMERIFKQRGLPVELTRLPLVESCFNLRAYSKVGAAGIWQFMPGTGRLFMRVDGRIDERRDPLTSTAAAADLLQRNYEVLGTWPLAITAYNHGRAGMARAVDQIGSRDLMEIIQRYRGPLFKFASRNFYAEFLAAVEVEREAGQHFGELKAMQATPCDIVAVPENTAIGILAQAAGTDAATLAELNPALTPDVASGRVPVPKGFALRVPRGQSRTFAERYAAIAPRLSIKVAKPGKAGRGVKHRGAASVYITHRVQRGQTLVSIARRYGTSVSAIARHNKLRSGMPVRAGQSLTIPKS